LVALAKLWHPDVNNGSAQSTAVFERILALHRAAERKLKADAWSAPDSLRIDTVDGRSFLLQIKRRHPFELGETAVTSERVAYLVEKQYGLLFENGIRRIEGLSYPDAKVRAKVSRFIPRIEAVYETATHRVAISSKTADALLLADLMAHLGGRMAPKHVAWLVSSLLNLACFFEVTGITHTL
jgi:hypothetical protein